MTRDEFIQKMIVSATTQGWPVENADFIDRAEGMATALEQKYGQDFFRFTGVMISNVFDQGGGIPIGVKLLGDRT